MCGLLKETRGRVAAVAVVAAEGGEQEEEGEEEGIITNGRNDERGRREMRYLQLSRVFRGSSMSYHGRPNRSRSLRSFILRPLKDRERFSRE